MAEPDQPEGGRPFRRAVFYFAGFDIFGPRYYYALFRAGLEQEFHREGRSVTITRAEAVADVGTRWSTKTNDHGHAVDVDYTVLTPHQMARRYHDVGLLRFLSAWAFTFYAYVRYGLLLRAVRHSWKFIIVLTVLAAVPLCFLAGAVAAGLVLGLLDVPTGVAALGIIGGGVIGLQLGLLLAGKTFATVALMGMYVGALHALGRTNELRELRERWSRHIAERIAAERWDEVLLVGHSLGAVPAIDIAADLLRRTDLPKARLALMTLGSTQPVVSAFPHAQEHREALATVATSPDLFWIDYESPSDYIALGSVDPVASVGLDLGGRERRWPILRPVYFRETLSGRTYRHMLLNLFARHFQYLKAADYPAAYSYFRLVCSARPLA